MRWRQWLESAHTLQDVLSVTHESRVSLLCNFAQAKARAEGRAQTIKDMFEQLQTKNTKRKHL